MPFRDPRVYLTREDLERERAELLESIRRSESRNPFKKLWWWWTDLFKRPKKEPPASW